MKFTSIKQKPEASRSFASLIMVMYITKLQKISILHYQANFSENYLPRRSLLNAFSTP